MFTTVSPGVTVTNLPSKLDALNYARVQIAPVEGAAKYYVLKTMALAEPKPVEIKVAHPRRSELLLLDCTHEWLPLWAFMRSLPNKMRRPPGQRRHLGRRSTGASWYHVYRTDTPHPRPRAASTASFPSKPASQPT